MIAEYHIKSIILKLYVMDIHFHISNGRVQVSREVIQVLHFTEAAVKTLFGSHMQNFMRSGKKVGFFFEVQPQ